MSKQKHIWQKLGFIMNGHYLGESLVSKPQSAFIPRWEDIQDNPKPDLRELLVQRKKRKEVLALEASDAP